MVGFLPFSVFINEKFSAGFDDRLDRLKGSLFVCSVFFFSVHNAWYVNAGRQGWKAVLISYIRANLEIGFLSDNILQLCKNTVFKLKAVFLTFLVVLPLSSPFQI